MPLMSRRAICYIFVVFCATTGGCGPKGPPPVGVVHGKVFFNGNPLGNVRVEFYPEGETGNKYLTSAATTQADGSFELMCDDGRTGAVVGVHRIVVKIIRDEAPRMNIRDADAQLPYQSPPMINLTPHNNLGTTSLRKEVNEGENTVELRLPI